MPSFASTQSFSGRSGRMGPCAVGNNVRGVSDEEGVGLRTGWGVGICGGCTTGLLADPPNKHGPSIYLARKPEFNSQRQSFKGSFSINGITRDSADAPLGNCETHLFQTESDVQLDEGISDGAGNYSFTEGSNSGNVYIVAYKPGSPDVAGTSVDTLTLTWNRN